MGMCNVRYRPKKNGLREYKKHAQSIKTAVESKVKLSIYGAWVAFQEKYFKYIMKDTCIYHERAR